MWQNLTWAAVALFVIAFASGFLLIRWGRVARNPERRNPWVFFDGGGS